MSTICVKRETKKKLEELQRLKYRKCVTANDLISAMIADLSKDLERPREVIKQLN